MLFRSEPRPLYVFKISLDLWPMHVRELVASTRTRRHPYRVLVVCIHVLDDAHRSSGVLCFRGSHYFDVWFPAVAIDYLKAQSESIFLCTEVLARDSWCRRGSEQSRDSSVRRRPAASLPITHHTDMPKDITLLLPTNPLRS